MTSIRLKPEFASAGTPDRRDVYLAVLLGVGGLVCTGIFLSFADPILRGADSAVFSLSWIADVARFFR